MSIESAIDFLIRSDGLKNVDRASTLADGTRPENAAEHSWHVALTALVLSGYALPGTNVNHAILMLVVHDIVEIDTGDFPIYSTGVDFSAVRSKERDAASKIFSKLPNSKADELEDLWLEFDRNESPEAKFAHCVDRVQPILLNLASEGLSWSRQAVTYEQVISKCMDPINDVSSELWEYLDGRIKNLYAKGNW